MRTAVPDSILTDVENRRRAVRSAVRTNVHTDDNIRRKAAPLAGNHAPYAGNHVTSILAGVEIRRRAGNPAAVLRTGVHTDDNIRRKAVPQFEPTVKADRKAINMPHNMYDPSVRALMRKEMKIALNNVRNMAVSPHNVTVAQANLARIVDKLGKRYVMVKHHIQKHNEYRTQKYEAEQILSEVLKRAIRTKSFSFGRVPTGPAKSVSLKGFKTLRPKP